MCMCLFLCRSVCSCVYARVCQRVFVCERVRFLKKEFQVCVSVCVYKCMWCHCDVRVCETVEFLKNLVSNVCISVCVYKCTCIWYVCERKSQKCVCRCVFVCMWSVYECVCVCECTCVCLHVFARARVCVYSQALIVFPSCQ
jgi:hypothetical protein